MQAVYFLGRFHVLILHLPIALVLLVALLEWICRGGRRPELRPALRFLWPAAAATAILTVILGYMHFSEGAFTGFSAVAHRALGTSVAVMATLGWLLSTGVRPLHQRASALAAAALVVLITLTGHFGGNLTHGDTYLVEFAPDAVRKMAGLEVARPPVSQVAGADVYLDVVRPILSARCFNCHNNDKRRGGLNLSHYDPMMKGGKDGPVIVAGNLQDSDLYRRISLPPDNKDAMPAEGKTPLSSAQIAIIGWWIQGGARQNVPVGRLPISSETNTLIAAQLGLGGSGEHGAGAAEPVRTADSKLLSKLNAAGFMARQVSRTDPHLVVSPMAPGARFAANELAALTSIPDQIVELDLPHAGLDDAAVETLARLTQLARLRLDRNQLTDQAIKSLGRLDKLEVLSVYGNRGIGDASVEVLGHMSHLRKVFLWNTSVSGHGIAKLQQMNSRLEATIGDDERSASAAVTR